MDYNGPNSPPGQLCFHFLKLSLSIIFPLPTYHSSLFPITTGSAKRHLAFFTTKIFTKCKEPQNAAAKINENGSPGTCESGKLPGHRKFPKTALNPCPKNKNWPQTKNRPKNKNRLGLSTERVKNKNHLGHKQDKHGEH